MEQQPCARSPAAPPTHGHHWEAFALTLQPAGRAARFRLAVGQTEIGI